MAEFEIVEFVGESNGHHEINKESDYVDKLKLEAADEAGDCGYDSVQIPTWFHKDKFERAKLVIRKHFMSMLFVQLCGLYLLVYIKSIRDVLIATGQSRNISLLFRRYLHTIKHVKCWFEGDLTDSNDNAFKSIATVRQMHKRVALTKSDSKEVKISQYDMVLTQFAFVGLLVLFPKKFGCSLSEYDLKCVLHFWRFVGYLLGVDDKYNLFSSDSEEVKRKCEKLLNVFKNDVNNNAPQSATEMSDGIVVSVNAYIPLLRPQSIRKFIFEIIGLHVTLKMSLAEKLINLLMKFHFLIWMRIRLFAIFFNFLLHVKLRKTLFEQEDIFKQLQEVDQVNENKSQSA